MPSARLRGLVGLAAAAVAAATSGVLAWRSAAAPPLPVLAALPPFELVAHTGLPFGSRELAGRPWIADFIFTRCAGVCPAMTARMVQLRKQLPPEVTFVSFSVDPAGDTPEVLARYARDFRADPPWFFVTGPQRALYALSTDGFKLEAFEVPPGQREAGGDGPFLHSSKFVLVDGRQRVRGYYDSGDEAAVARLRADVVLLQREAP